MKTDDGAGARKPSGCPADCQMCSSEFCAQHLHAPCDCETLERHNWERGGVGSVGQGERAGDEWITPEKVGSGEIGRRIQHFYEDDEKAEAHPEAGAVTEYDISGSGCVKCRGLGRIPKGCVCFSLKGASVAPSVEELDAARSHLRVALSQTLHTDDQIIIGHIRSALEALGSK
jgi:hypothetical protein